MRSLGRVGALLPAMISSRVALVSACRSSGARYAWMEARRENRGDPGPSTSAHRKSQRQALIDRIRPDGRGEAPLTSAELGVLVNSERVGRQPARTSKAAGDGDRPHADRGQTGFIRQRGGSVVVKQPFGVRNNAAEPQAVEGMRAGTHRDGLRTWKANEVGQSGNFRPRRSDDDAYKTVEALQRFLDSRPSPKSDIDIQEAIAMVKQAPKSAVNVVVWNVLLRTLAREGRLSLMWTTFNDMKKYGHKPTCRTFIVMLNGFSGAAHSGAPLSSHDAHQPTPKIRSNAAIIWHQARLHLDSTAPNVIQASSGIEIPPTAGYAAESEESDQHGDSPKVRQATVNAYLKFLAKYGMYAEIVEVWRSTVGRGEQIDVIGYTTMLQGLLFAARKQAAWNLTAERNAPPSQSGRRGDETANRKLPTLEICQNAKAMWEMAVEQHGGRSPDHFGIDNTIALMAVSVFMLGRQADQQYAIEIIEKIWGLPPLLTKKRHSWPSEVNTADDAATPTSESETTTSSTLPRLRIDVRTAGSVINSLNYHSRATLAAHYARYFLSDSSFSRKVDTSLLQAAAIAFADTNDFFAIEALVRTYAPPEGGWRMGFWYDCLSAGRWSGNWDGVKWVIKVMKGLPPGVETSIPLQVSGVTKSDGQRAKDETGSRGAPKRNDTGQLGDGAYRDIARRLWVPQQPVSLDSKAGTIIIKAALSRSKEAVREAITILESQGLDSLLPGYEAENASEYEYRLERSAVETGELSKKRSKTMLEWQRELAKEMIRGVEWMLEGKAEGEEKGRWGVMEKKLEGYLVNSSTEMAAIARGRGAMMSDFNTGREISDGRASHREERLDRLQHSYTSDSQIRGVDSQLDERGHRGANRFGAAYPEAPYRRSDMYSRAGRGRYQHQGTTDDDGAFDHESNGDASGAGRRQRRSGGPRYYSALQEISGGDVEASGTRINLSGGYDRGDRDDRDSLEGQASGRTGLARSWRR